jgi:hypothetical protein
MADTPKNSSLDDLYKAVGHAISNWSHVELQLYQIFAIATGLTAMQPGGGYSTNNEIGIAVLDSVDGWRAKLQMVSAALQAALANLDDEARNILNTWAIEQVTINALHGNRSKLAHWRAETIGRPKPQTGTRMVRLAPPFFSKKLNGVWETDIVSWGAEFTEAAKRLSRLAGRLASHRGLQRKFVEQVASQVLCNLPDDPTLLEFLKQQLSGHLKP